VDPATGADPVLPGNQPQPPSGAVPCQLHELDDGVARRFFRGLGDVEDGPDQHATAAEGRVRRHGLSIDVDHPWRRTIGDVLDDLAQRRVEVDRSDRDLGFALAATDDDVHGVSPGYCARAPARSTVDLIRKCRSRGDGSREPIGQGATSYR
jgi:hypothetical protein